ncbi:MAG: hypothetical protein KAI61_06920 [Alphaproteobacteria bacterium]|nr:hypothetical protein [Alphaproteobacteria bacterium]
MLNRLIGIVVFLGIAVFFAFPVFAEGKEGTAVAKKETLVAFWEEQVRNDSNTKQFEKTKEDGVYNFETSFFPYKGRLKLLNAAVSQMNGTYQIDTAGIIEVELLDAPQDFYKKHARSYRAWSKTWSESGYYYYDQKQDVWFLPSEWEEHEEEDDCISDASPEFLVFLVKYLPLLILFIFLGGLFWFVYKQNKRAWDSNDEMLVNQNIAMQKMDKQTKLLQQIADSMAKKQK